jgi:hypothetical protein
MRTGRAPQSTMGPVPRRPLQVLRVISALAFITTAALSLRARWATDLVTVSTRFTKSPVFLRNQVYCVSVDWGDTRFRQRGLVEYRWQPVDRSGWRVKRADAVFSVPGIHWFGDRIFVAHWMVSLVTLPLPLLVLFRWVHRSRRYAGRQCVACGYDLRASSDRCPECGAPVPTPVPDLAKPLPVALH